MIAMMDSADVVHFCEIVEKRLGLRFEGSRRESAEEILRARLNARRLEADEYLNQLQRPGEQAEWRILAQQLTVGETYFFRHIEQFRAFSEVALPVCMAASKDRHLRILSAGCATGEEAFSLAMLIKAAGLDQRWKVSITGIDLNTLSLEKAMAGQYHAWSLRDTPAAMQEQWFRARGNQYLLDQRIRDMVRFEERNLMLEAPDLWCPGQYDIIFCRNVLMYFSPQTMAEIVDRMTHALVPGGYLFLGHAETLRGLSQNFHLCHTHESFYYQRRDNLGLRAAASSSITLPAPLAGILDQGESWADAIRQASDRVKALTPDKANAPAAPAVWDLRGAMSLLQQERYAEALAEIAALPAAAHADIDVLLLHAVLLTHSGQLDEAAQVCTRLLEIDELSASAQYVLALCYEAAGDLSAAKEHDQLATYLDPAFAMPRLHLGLLARKKKEYDAARRELEEALALLQREDPSRLLLFGGGFSRSALLALCQAELQACER